MNSPSSDRHDSALFQSMVLLATLTTATTVWQRMRARRNGIDPSEQETRTVVVPALRQAAAEVQTYLMRLQTTLMHLQAYNEVPGIAQVRYFDALITLHRLSGRLQEMHQRLLSLYPAISAGLAEEARRCWVASETFPEQVDEQDDATWAVRLAAFVRQGFDVVDWVQQEVEVL